MPRTDVVFYQEGSEDVPVLDWLKELRRTDQRAYESCVGAISRLADYGHELRRPLADLLRDGIYELRIRKGHVNIRILYFFHGRNVAILCHALTKEDKLPKNDIEKALLRNSRKTDSLRLMESASSSKYWSRAGAAFALRGRGFLRLIEKVTVIWKRRASSDGEN